MTLHPEVDSRHNLFKQAQSYAGLLMRRQGMVMLGIALFIWAWMLVYALLYHTPRYTSEAMVIIKDSALTTRYVESEQYYAVPTTSSSSANPVLNTMGLIQSTAIRQELFNFLREKHPEELKRLEIDSQRKWEEFFRDGSSIIKTKNKPGTDLITVQYRWERPGVAQESLTVLLTAFQQASLTLNKAENENKGKYLASQEADIQQRLEAIRKEKSLFKQENDTLSLRRESDELAATRIQLGNTLADVQAKASGKASEVRRYEQMLGMPPAAALRAGALGQNATMARLHDELYRLTQQEAQLKASLTDDNPKVSELSAQIEQLKRNISAETARTLGYSSVARADGPNAAQVSIADSTRGMMLDRMVSAQADGMRLNAESGVLRKRLDEVNATIHRYPSVEESLANLEQQEASLSAALDTLRQKLLDVRMRENQTMSNVFIVDAPSLPRHESFPATKHLLVLGLLIGVFGGLGGGILKDRLENRRRHTLLEWRPSAIPSGPVPVAEVPSVRASIRYGRASYPQPRWSGARMPDSSSRFREPATAAKRFASFEATS